MAHVLTPLTKIVAKILAVAAMTAALCAVPASAGIITHSFGFPGPDPVASGPGLGLASVPVVITPTPNNDNVPAMGVLDNNLGVVNKRFDFTDYIDIVFTVAPSEGVTEYQFIEFVDNNTGIDWVRYRVQLGFGTGAGFTLATPLDNLTFDTPLFDTPPTSTAMVPTLLTFNELEFSGLHGTGAEQYTFRIDVPDLSAIGALGEFTLRQVPVPIPEPSSMTLAAMAGIGLVGYGIRRRRKS